MQTVQPTGYFYTGKCYIGKLYFYYGTSLILILICKRLSISGSFALRSPRHQYSYQALRVVFHPAAANQCLKTAAAFQQSLLCSVAMTTRVWNKTLDSLIGTCIIPITFAKTSTYLKLSTSAFCVIVYSAAHHYMQLSSVRHATSILNKQEVTKLTFSKLLQKLQASSNLKSQCSLKSSNHIIKCRSA